MHVEASFETKEYANIVHFSESLVLDIREGILVLDFLYGAPPFWETTTYPKGPRTEMMRFHGPHTIMLMVFGP